MSCCHQKKEVIYRGGVVRFFIPTHWREEYEEDGGGIFYEPSENTGTLRLNVLSFLAKEDVLPSYPLEIIRKRSVEYRGKVEELPDSRFLLKYSMNARENDEDLVVYYWEVARMVSPRDYNIAVFSFTIGLNEMKSASAIGEEVAAIEDEIKNVKFWVHADLYEI